MATKLTPGQKLDALIAKANEKRNKMLEAAKAKGIEEDDIDWAPLFAICEKMEELVSEVNAEFNF